MASPSRETVTSTPNHSDPPEKHDKKGISVTPLQVGETTPTKKVFFDDIDGGLRGWSAVVGAWLIQFAMVGAVSAFGSFQTFYEQTWLKTYSHSEIAWIGSLQLFLEFFLGVIGGVLLDGGQWRYTVGGGSALFVFTFFMLSLCKAGQFAPILLSQGIGMGTGLGFAYLPVSGIVSKHFTRRRSFAMGIITTGTSLGGFAFSVLASKLLGSRVGFAWTVRISAFIATGCMLLANFLITEPKKKAEVVEIQQNSQEKISQSEGNEEETASAKEEKPRTVPELLRDPAYLSIIASGFVVCLGLYFPMFAIQSFALHNAIGPGLASWLLSIINLSSVLGRTIPNWLADRYGTLELYVPCTAAAGVLLFCLGVATNPAGIVVFCFLYGFFSGSIVSLYFPTVVALDPHVGTTGVRLGIACLPVAFASLVGSPIAEALVSGGKHWWHGIAFAGTAELVSAALLAFAWTVEKKRKLQKRL
ncbi:MFS general substrate transporter [Periconia macrospinosa]|uniref:MFS general substrate transporter n=1 Tax=Periconia macrospinosa TaxID=97972 RepID=A0A2V1D854_9PLEO|nr:MFS general substrate transporter [Periconia macrospinosa]